MSKHEHDQAPESSKKPAAAPVPASAPIPDDTPRREDDDLSALLQSSNPELKPKP